jgi:outer membrane protein assembly factor BamB
LVTQRQLSFLCRVPLVVTLWSVAFNTAPADDESWMHWRGPYQNGSAAASAAPPVSWSDTENLKWIAELPGHGTSTPIVLNDRIYLTSAVETDRRSESPVVQNERSKTVAPDVYYQFVVSCIDRANGEIVWQSTATEQVPHEGHHPTHTYAASSPTTDGTHLFVSFGSFGIYCYTLDGELVWNRDLGDMRTRYGWGEAVTPVIDGDRVIVNWDQEEGSFITALNAATGEPLWKTNRPGEVTSWNTPLIVHSGGRTLAVANGTEFAAAYDTSNGKLVWRCAGQTVNAIPSPVQFKDTVICMSGYRSAVAVAIPIESTGDVTGSPTLRWTWDRGTPYVPSPTLSGNRLFFTRGNNDILTCLDAATGRPLAQDLRLSGVRGMYASGLAANGHLYFAGRRGTTVVLKDDASLSVASVNQIDDAFDASPVAVGTDLLLRSWTKLYCLTSE